ncbi:MAG: Na/Pi cotransporter family protein [Oscillospiraceae bacterium]|nr:Na/Pi cotransporter family protein [Oscillospiraceae bacterium]MBQ8378826.1 Na/Pi cotransporter family protein [Oscillospiraceae bacterium]
MTIFNVFSLLGGLAFFLYGMNVMGETLEKMAGSKLKTILASLTSNTFKGFMLGLLVTAVIQSSSATTVMVVGFVNSGIMTLGQSIGVIMGANLGTSVTSWLLSLTGIEGDSFFIQICKPANFTPVLAFIGIAIVMFSKSQKKKDVAIILIAFAVLMFGMETMSSAVDPLTESEKFKEILVLFSNPVLGLIVGTVFTAIVQSSSASVGILQALTLTGTVTYATAIPIVMGQNIGTCVSAMLSSIGAGKNAKRAAVIHLSFNVISAAVLLTLYSLANLIFGFEFIETAADPFGIAVVHTVFKVLALMMLMPLSKQLEKLACFIVKDSKEDIEKDEEFKVLDDRFIHSPAFAIEQCKKLTDNMADITRDSMLRAVEITNGYNEELDKYIYETESRIDNYEDKLGTYLVKISANELSAEDGKNISTLLHCIGDFERISDHATNIVKASKEMNDKGIVFSGDAKKELDIMSRAVADVLNLTVEAFINNDLEKAHKVEPLEEVIDGLKTRLKSRHVKRLRDGECTIELGFVFADFITNFERVSDHCSNIAVCLIQMADANFEVHDYIHELKASGEEFEKMVEEYQQIYKLPAKNF